MGHVRGDGVSEPLALIPVDLTLPQTVEEVYGFRIQIGAAISKLMDLKSRADGVIAEDMGDRRERVVDGVLYEYSGTAEWVITDVGRLLALLTKLEGDGELTHEEYHEIVTITPQPDLVRVDNRKLNALVAKRGLTQIDAFRERLEGAKKLKVKR